MNSTLLLSTSSLWNCGDDFIRDGVLNLIRPREHVRQIWWNRGFGIADRFANDLNVNLPLMDYFVIAGTPRWIFNNERVISHCLKHAIPMAIIGVGTAEFVGPRGYALLRQVARSGLCEVALARDELALSRLRELGFQDAELMLDPCFFKPPRPATERIWSVVGWRSQYTLDGDPRLPMRYPVTVMREVIRRRPWRRSSIATARASYDDLLCRVFENLPEPRRVVVHDNREIIPAEKIFGRENVFYATDPAVMFEVFARTRLYVGSRIHGAIPVVIHGGCARLLYATSKASVLVTARRILEGYDPGLGSSIATGGLDANVERLVAPPDRDNMTALRQALATEMNRIRNRLFQCPRLSALMS